MINTEIDSAEAARTPPPQQVLVQISQGMWLAQTVATAARLGIADALAQSQPQNSTTLAMLSGRTRGHWHEYSALWPAWESSLSRFHTNIPSHLSANCSAATSLTPCAIG